MPHALRAARSLWAGLLTVSLLVVGMPGARADELPSAAFSGSVTSSDGAVGSATLYGYLVDGVTGSWTPNGGSEGYAVSRDDGSFAMEGLVDGALYRLKVINVGSGKVGGWVTANGGVSDWSTDAATFTAGSAVTSILVDDAASISGAFRDSVGPAAGRVSFQAYQRHAGSGVWEYRQSGWTDDGAFNLSGLRSGTPYVVCATADRPHADGCYAGDGQPVVMTKDEGLAVTAPAVALDILMPTRLARLDPASNSWADVAVGQTITAPDPVWNASDVALTYHWSSSGTTIADATGRTYTVRPEDLGGYVNVAISATKSGFAPGEAAWGHHFPVVRGAAPVASSVPSVTGTQRVGSTLTINAGSWPQGTTFAYSWRHVDGTQRSSARTLLLTASDFGKTFAAVVTATLRGYEPAVVEAGSVQIGLGLAPAPTYAPKIIGLIKPGSRITVSSGTWPTTGLRSTYRWWSGSVLASSNQSPSYDLSLSDVGKTVTVEVRVAKPGYAPYVRKLKTTVVPKLVPTVKGTLAQTVVSTSSRAKVTVTVKGQTSPSGTVTVRYGTRYVAVTMKPSSNGKVVVTLPRLKKGSYAVTATYTPIYPSNRWLTSKKVTVGKLVVK
jgi:hypothetical protein